MWRRTVALAALAATLACGYRFTPEGGELPAGVRSVYVPVFTNRTAEPAIEGVFTDALRQELARRGRVGGEFADARAEGEITQVVGSSGIVTLFDAGSPSVQAKVTTFRVTAYARVRLKRGSETLADVAVSGTEDFLNVEGSILETEANRRNAIRRLATTLMEQAYARLASGF